MILKPLVEKGTFFSKKFFLKISEIKLIPIVIFILMRNFKDKCNFNRKKRSTELKWGGGACA